MAFQSSDEGYYNRRGEDAGVEKPTGRQRQSWKDAATAREHRQLEPPEGGRAKWPPWSSLREHGPINILVSAIRSQNCKRIDFCCFNCLVCSHLF